MKTIMELILPCSAHRLPEKDIYRHIRHSLALRACLSCLRIEYMRFFFPAMEVRLWIS